MGCLWKGCSLNGFLMLNCLILAFMGFSKNGNWDNNLAFVNSLTLGFIVFQENGSCFNNFILLPCKLIIISFSDKNFWKIIYLDG